MSAAKSRNRLRYNNRGITSLIASNSECGGIYSLEHSAMLRWHHGPIIQWLGSVMFSCFPSDYMSVMIIIMAWHGQGRKKSPTILRVCSSFLAHVLCRQSPGPLTLLPGTPPYCHKNVFNIIETTILDRGRRLFRKIKKRAFILNQTVIQLSSPTTASLQYDTYRTFLSFTNVWWLNCAIRP